MRYDPATSLHLAQEVHDAVIDLQGAALLWPALRTKTSDEVAAYIEDAVKEHFGDSAPEGADRRRTVRKCRRIHDA